MKELDSVQVAQLKRIAERLLETRQQKSISLDAVAMATYIPQRLLQALELEQFERLPEPVYVQGFIRRYGDYLGLDGKALSQTFEINPIAPPSPVLERPEAPVVVPPPAAPTASGAPINTPPKAASTNVFSNRAPESSAPPERSTPPVDPAIVPPKSVTPPTVSVPQPMRPVPPTAAPLSEATQSTQSSSAPTAAMATSRPPVTQSSPTASVKRPVLPLALAGGAIALLAIGTIAILNQPKSTDRSTASNSAVSDPTANIAPSPVPATGTSIASTPAPSAPSASNAPVQVAVNLTDRAWLEVVVDGKVEVEDVKEKGFQKTWTAERELFIRSGNAGAVLVSFNRSEAKPMGKVGQVEEATYTPDRAAKPTSDSISQSATDPTVTQLQSSSPN